MRPRLILYGTTGCHLCDEAEQQLRQVGLTWQGVDIADDDLLMERYGTSIPVLVRNDNGAKISWPFFTEDILRLVSEG